MQKKYQIFISSTFHDLVDERQDAIRSVLDLGHIPSGMEIFPAADVEQFEYIKKVVDECDYYVLIIGGRYGSVDEAGVSFTEKEYAYAVEQSKVVLAFLHGDVGSIPVAKSDTNPSLVDRLSAFRSKASKGRLVQFWRTRDDLRAKVITSLAKAMSESPGVGWIRGNAAATEDLLQQITTLRARYDALSTEAQTLRAALIPRVENLADFESTFNVRFSVSEYDRFTSKYKTRNTSHSVTWREIFAAVGPFFIRPGVPTLIGSLILRYLKENRNIDKDVTYDIFESDQNTIKMQLFAYGLTNLYSAEENTGGVIEFMSLTDKGTRQLIESMSVRR